MKNQDGEKGTKYRFHGEDNSCFCLIDILLAGGLEQIADGCADHTQVEDAKPALCSHSEMCFLKQEQADDGQRDGCEHLDKIEDHGAHFLTDSLVRNI